jgi:hypothetical protein
MRSILAEVVLDVDVDTGAGGNIWSLLLWLVCELVSPVK